MRAIQAAHRPVRLAHVPPEPLGDEHDQREHGEADERQLPVHDQQHDHDPDQREDVTEDRDDAGGEQFVQDVHVARDARHQPPDRIPVVEAEIQRLQARVDPASAGRT